MPTAQTDAETEKPVDPNPYIEALQRALNRKWEYEAATHPASARMVRAFVEACDAYGAHRGLERPEVAMTLEHEPSFIDDLAGGKPITVIDLDSHFDYLETIEALHSGETVQ